MTSRSIARPGFTLVETIVVVGTIALLIGLMTPALSSVRSATRSLECQSNLRQMVIAATNYSATWNRYPAALRYDSIDGQFRQIAWDWVTTYDGQVLDSGSLWQGVANPGRVQQCPAYQGHSNTAGDPFTGYNYNTTYIGGEASGWITGWDAVRPGIPSARCRRSETCAMFGCGGYRNGANKFMRAPLASEGVGLNTVYSGGQAFRHAGATNVGFVDGHVGSHRSPKRGKHATAELLNEFLGFPLNGFLSDDDSAYDPR